jgi:tetratricopeptide (TPR) repeat protein
MKITRFARVDLPDYREKAFEDLLLGRDAGQTRRADGSAMAEQGKKGGSVLHRAQEAYFRGNYLDALKHYSEVLARDERESTAWVGQTRVLVDIGEYDGAVYWADKGYDACGGGTILSFAKALALAYAGQIAQAKSLINVPVEKDEAAMLWLLRGEVLIRLRINFIQKIFTPYKGIGRLGAFFCFVKALSHDQYDPFVNQRIGLAYMLARERNRAMEHLGLSLRTVSDNPLTLFGIAQCYKMKRDYGQALCYVKKAIAGNPKLDCAFELLEWLHGPGRRFSGMFKRKEGKERS